MMRENVSFDSATETIMADRLSLMDHLELPARRSGRHGDDRDLDDGSDRRKAKKGGGKGDGARRARSPYQRRGRSQRGRRGRSSSAARRSRSHSGKRQDNKQKKGQVHTTDNQGKEICKKWNAAPSSCKGRCRNDRAHVCHVCLSWKHAACEKRKCSQQ